MILTSTHTTTYLYSAPVSICHTEVHLAPRVTASQAVLEHEVEVSPKPDCTVKRTDYFGNEVMYFSIHEPHGTLTVTSVSKVELRGDGPPDPSLTPAWETVRDDAERPCEFGFASPLVPVGPEFAKYAAPSFPEGRPVMEAALDLCHRIFTEFKYDQQATNIGTPVREVLERKRGVCQDFAHLMIACLRSLGLPARYVSGYLRSGKNTIGAEASHAWVSLHCPGFGWLDFDPTNDVMPHRGHVTLAWGRDYTDVTPVKGVAVGGGGQVINVSVQVLPSGD